MAVPDLDNLLALLDDAECFALVRQHRWPNGVRCPACASSTVIRDGCDDTQRSRQRYRCKACSGRFDDLTGTVLAGHHQPLRVWVLCLYFMGLNLSNRQIAAELGLNAADVQAMTEQLRGGLAARIPEVTLAAPVELNVRPALRTGDHRADRDYQDIDQLMIAPARRARIGEHRELPAAGVLLRRNRTARLLR